MMVDVYLSYKTPVGVDTLDLRGKISHTLLQLGWGITGAGSDTEGGADVDLECHLADLGKLLAQTQRVLKRAGAMDGHVSIPLKEASR